MRYHTDIYRCGKIHYGSNHSCTVSHAGTCHRSVLERRNKYRLSTNQHQSTNSHCRLEGTPVALDNLETVLFLVHKSSGRTCRLPSQRMSCFRRQDNQRFGRRLVLHSLVHNSILQYLPGRYRGHCSLPGISPSLRTSSQHLTNRACMHNGCQHTGHALGSYSCWDSP